MVITGMAHFQSVCKRKLVNWYNNQIGATKIDLDNVFIDKLKARYPEGFTVENSLHRKVGDI